MPGYKEIMELLGFKSKNAVFKLIGRLVEEGVVEKDKKGKLLPRRLFGEPPLLGVVEAGIPAEAEEQVLDAFALDEFLIKKPDKTFLLKVQGESMIEAHIMEDDLVLAERAEQARPGKIVIAEVDGEWTLKYYRERNGKPYLEPANKNFKLIFPKKSLRVAAVVKAVIRKFT